MSRGSSKPCPGCKKVALGRAAKDVCQVCEERLEKAERMERILSALSDDEIVVKFARFAHWNEYIYTKSGAGRNLMDMFQCVALAGSRPSVEFSSEFRLLGSIDSGGTAYAVMSHGLAEAIRDLRMAVGEALKLEYEQGKADGHNLLMRLASGDLSMNDFSVKTKEDK